MTNNLPNGLVECSPQSSKTLKQDSQDPMSQATCPGVNNSCSAAQVVVFPNSSDPFAKAVFTTSINLGSYTVNMPAPLCGIGGRDAVWQIPPSIGSRWQAVHRVHRGSNFDTMLAVWTGSCSAGGSNLIAVSCIASNIGLQGVQLSFNTDGTNTFFIVGEGPVGQYGKPQAQGHQPVSKRCHCG